MGPNIVFWQSKSYFDIRTVAKYRVLTFKILFWHSKWGQISYFDIQNPILTFELVGTNIVFVTIKILLWHLNWDWILYFDIQNPILTFEMVLLKICQYIYPWSWRTCIKSKSVERQGKLHFDLAMQEKYIWLMAWLEVFIMEYCLYVMIIQSLDNSNIRSFP